MMSWAQSTNRIMLPLPPELADEVPCEACLISLARSGSLAHLLTVLWASPVDRSLIFDITAGESPRLWLPGVNYQCGSLWYADAAGRIFGFDIHRPGRIYICRYDGRHVGDLELQMPLAGRLTPRGFWADGEKIAWCAADGQVLQATHTGRGVAEIRPGDKRRLPPNPGIPIWPADKHGSARAPYLTFSPGQLVLVM